MHDRNIKRKCKSTCFLLNKQRDNYLSYMHNMHHLKAKIIIVFLILSDCKTIFFQFIPREREC